MVELGGADPLDHLDAEALDEPAMHLGGQRLAGGHDEAQAREVGLLCSRMSEHLRHHRRHVDEDRRPVALDQLEDALRGRPLREDDPGRTDPEREQRGHVAGVAEEELRHRQHPVALLVSEHASGVALEGDHGVVRSVHGRLRRPRAAGGELPQRLVVLRRRRRLEVVGLPRRRCRRTGSPPDAAPPRRRRAGAAGRRGSRSPRAWARAWSRRRRRPAPRCTPRSSDSPSPAGTCRPPRRRPRS